jgi:alginate O-acetyltransferase complex protein AlgI
MSFAAVSPDWQMTALFFLAVLPLCLAMKCVAFWGATKSQKDWALVLSPFPTPASVKRALPLSAGPRIILRFLLALGICIWAYWLYWNRLRAFRLPPIVLSYLGAIMLWIVSEASGAAAIFLAVPWRSLLPFPHGAAPPLAKSLSDFWGRRWNVWMSDWFRQIIFSPLKAHPVFALLLVFLVSGVLHEWVINVPLFIVTGRNCFGSMIAYFLLQALGILLERKTRNEHVRRLLVWLFVFGAAPLIVNEGLLRVLHLWPD